MEDVFFDVKFGKGTMSFNIPQKNIAGIMRTRETEKISDINGSIRKALDNSIGCEPLRCLVRPGEKVIIVVNDITRVVGTDRFLPVIVDVLNESGIPDDHITIIIATGLHRTHSEKEHRYIIGDKLYERLKIVDHVGTDSENMVYIGTTKAGTEVQVNRLVTEADRVILTGEITYHMTAGYSGGRKSILPGVCSSKTINQNHKFMLLEEARQGRLNDNLQHLDMIEAARMLAPDFIFNVILDKDRDFVYMAAGDMELAHAAGIEIVDKLFAVEIDKLADVVLVNCGGYPKDIEFYQSQKTLDNAMRAVKEGGTVILLAACLEGVGSDDFHILMKRYNTPSEVVAYVRNNFKMGEHKAFLTSRLLERAETVLISEMPDKTVEELMMRPAHSVDEALEYVKKKHGDDYSVYVMPDGFLTVPFLKERGNE